MMLSSILTCNLLLLLIGNTNFAAGQSLIIKEVTHDSNKLQRKNENSSIYKFENNEVIIISCSKNVSGNEKTHLNWKGGRPFVCPSHNARTIYYNIKLTETYHNATLSCHLTKLMNDDNEMLIKKNMIIFQCTNCPTIPNDRSIFYCDGFESEQHLRARINGITLPLNSSSGEYYYNENEKITFMYEADDSGFYSVSCTIEPSIERQYHWEYNRTAGFVATMKNAVFFNVSCQALHGKENFNSNIRIMFKPKWEKQSRKIVARNSNGIHVLRIKNNSSLPMNSSYEYTQDETLELECSVNKSNSINVYPVLKWFQGNTEVKSTSKESIKYSFELTGNMNNSILACKLIDETPIAEKIIKLFYNPPLTTPSPPVTRSDSTPDIGTTETQSKSKDSHETGQTGAHKDSKALPEGSLTVAIWAAIVIAITVVIAAILCVVYYKRKALKNQDSLSRVHFNSSREELRAQGSDDFNYCTPSDASGSDIYCDPYNPQYAIPVPKSQRQGGTIYNKPIYGNTAPSSSNLHRRNIEKTAPHSSKYTNTISKGDSSIMKSSYINLKNELYKDDKYINCSPDADSQMYNEIYSNNSDVGSETLYYSEIKPTPR